MLHKFRKLSFNAQEVFQAAQLGTEPFQTQFHYSIDNLWQTRFKRSPGYNEQMFLFRYLLYTYILCSDIVKN